MSTWSSHERKLMLKNMTRSRLLQIWFAAVALIAAAGAALGADMTLGTWGLLLALSLVPPVLVLFLWPGAQPITASDVLHGTDRRP
jgi:hypothetical protein